MAPAPNPTGTPGDLQRRRYTLTEKGWAATQPADERPSDDEDGDD